MYYFSVTLTVIKILYLSINAYQMFSFSKKEPVLCYAKLHPTLCDPMDAKSTRLFCPWNSPGKNTGVGCHFLLQGIFPTQELNSSLLCLLHWQGDSLPPCHLGKLKWIHQFSSVTQSCPTLCDPMHRSTPGLPVHHQLPEYECIDGYKDGQKEESLSRWDQGIKEH